MLHVRGEHLTSFKVLVIFLAYKAWNIREFFEKLIVH
jgi:hypothetical protein